MCLSNIHRTFHGNFDLIMTWFQVLICRVEGKCCCLFRSVLNRLSKKRKLKLSKLTDCNFPGLVSFSQLTLVHRLNTDLVGDILSPAEHMPLSSLFLFLILSPVFLEICCVVNSLTPSILLYPADHCDVTKQHVPCLLTPLSDVV